MEPIETKLNTVKGDKCTLIIDTRESAVTLHKEEMSTINHVIDKVEIGDYCVVSPSGTIMAIIERKSLTDFAASFKDGRSENIQKMIDLRSKTNCRILYIIEGKAFPQPTDMFANIPYANIESSMFHISVRDGVTFLYTQNTLSTAKMLVRFMKSMDTLTKDGDVDIGVVPTPNMSASGACDYNAIELLKEKYQMTTLDVVRNMWGCFNGIKAASADNYIYTWTIKEIITQQVSKETISSFRLNNGKLITAKTVKGLLSNTPTLERKLLSSIMGISPATATEMLANTRLTQLLNMNAAQLSQIKVGKAQRCLGELKASRIIECFNYKHTKQ